MKDFNLKVEFTENGSAFIKAYCAYYLDKEGDVCKGLWYTNEEQIKNEIKIHSDILGYKYLYTDTKTIFLC